MRLIDRPSSIRRQTVSSSHFIDLHFIITIIAPTSHFMDLDIFGSQSVCTFFGFVKPHSLNFVSSRVLWTAFHPLSVMPVTCTISYI